jgi:hypothetical protein
MDSTLGALVSGFGSGKGTGFLQAKPTLSAKAEAEIKAVRKRRIAGSSDGLKIKSDLRE